MALTDSSGLGSSRSSRGLPWLPRLLYLGSFSVCCSEPIIKPSVVLWSNCYLYTCIFEFAYGRGQVQYCFIVSPSWTSLKVRSLIKKKQISKVVSLLCGRPSLGIEDLNVNRI